MESRMDFIRHKNVTWYEDIQQSIIEFDNSPEGKKQRLENEFSADPSEDNQYYWIQTGEYYRYFEDSESVLKRKPTIYDYHNLYLWILREIRTEINDCVESFNNDSPDYTIKDDEKLSEWEIEAAFEKEQDKLDYVFDEYVLRIYESDNEAIESTINSQLRGNIAEFISKKIKNKSNELNEWQKYLIDFSDFMYEDGKRVKRGKLNETFCLYQYHTNTTETWRWIHEHFLQDTNNRFSKSACDKARDFANTHKPHIEHTKEAQKPKIYFTPL